MGADAHTSTGASAAEHDVRDLDRQHEPTTKGDSMTTATMQEQKHTGEMSEINRSGDTRIIWDKDIPAEVAAAKAAFNALVGKKKYAAFEVKGRKGDKGS